MHEAKRLQAPFELVVRGRRDGQASGAELRRRRHRDAGRRGALHVARRRGDLRRLRHLQVDDPEKPARAIVKATTHWRDAAGARRGGGVARRRHEGHRGGEPARRSAAPDARMVSFPRTGAGRGVAILALQGDFEAHRKTLAAIGPRRLRGPPAGRARVRRRTDPSGGESTTLWKFFEAEPWEDALGDFAGSGRPILGTCAGAIVLAREVTHPSAEGARPPRHFRRAQRIWPAGGLFRGLRRGAVARRNAAGRLHPRAAHPARRARASKSLRPARGSPSSSGRTTWRPRPSIPELTEDRGCTRSSSSRRRRGGASA